MPGSGCYDWLKQPISNRAQEDAIAPSDSWVVRCESRHLRRASRVPRSTGGRRDLQQASGDTADAPSQSTGSPRPPPSALGCGLALGPDPESAPATVRRHQAEHRLGDGHHLHPHVARLALPGRRHGSVLAHDRRVGRHIHHSSGARAQCCTDGRAPSPAARRVDSLDQGTQFGSDAWRRFCRSNHLL